MTARETTVFSAASVGGVERAPLIAAALGFISLYLAAELVVPNLATSPMPQPDTPAADAQDWYAQNRLTVATIGAALFDSAGCLGWFVSRFTRARLGQTAATSTVRRASAWGFASVVLLMLSSALIWVLAAVAVEASYATVSALRTAAYVAGGAAHVTTLGAFVYLASRSGGLPRPFRALGYVGAAIALASLFTLVVPGAAAPVTVGRVLCMAWIVVAAVGVAQHGEAGGRR